jgi:3-oxoacyl-[acyl-carrier-protein] synthase II
MPRPVQERRVVVTGLGLVTPLGRTPAAIWSRWAEGYSAAAPITRFDARSLTVKAGCEVRDFDPRKEVKNRKLLRLMIGGEDFGYRAATDALAQANIQGGDLDPFRCGLAIGCHKEGFRHQNLHDACKVSCHADGSLDLDRFVTDGWSRVPPQVIIEALPNVGLYYIAHDFELQGPNCNLLSNGAAGLQALGEGMHTIAEDAADVMVAGSFDTWVHWMCIGHNLFTGVLSVSTEEPAKVQRPFDVRRTGCLPGEGAGLFVLEEWQHARRRGVPILGELLGAASAVGVPSHDDAAGVDSVANCLTAAMASAGCTPADIDLIQLHGDATPRGDWIEAHGVRAAFGTLADRLLCTTLKSATGLMGNASGPVETVAALESLRRGEVLPIINLDEPDPDLPLTFVQRPLSGQRLRRAVVIHRTPPGLCSALVVGPPPSEP